MAPVSETNGSHSGVRSTRSGDSKIEITISLVRDSALDEIGMPILRHPRRLRMEAIVLRTILAEWRK